MDLDCVVRGFGLRCSWIWIALFVDWPLICSLTGEARMFWLDEVGNSKKILIKGQSFKRLTLTNPCFADDWRCFVGAKQTWDVWLPPSVLLSPT